MVLNGEIRSRLIHGWSRLRILSLLAKTLKKHWFYKQNQEKQGSEDGNHFTVNSRLIHG